MIDSFAQTEGGTAQGSSAAGQSEAVDAVDSGINALEQNTSDDQPKATFTSEEDVALLVEAASHNVPLSQEVSNEFDWIIPYDEND